MANVKQLGTIIGKVIYAGVGEVKTAKSGTEYVEYGFGIQTNNGVSIFNTAKLYNPNSPAQFTADLMAKYDRIVDDYKDEPIYVKKTVKPSKNKETKVPEMSFDVLRGYVKKDGTVAFSTTGNLEEVEHEIMLNEEGEETGEVMITFKGQKGDYTKMFSELNTKITVEMIVKSIEGRTFTLFDGKADDEFPLTVIGDLVEGMDPNGAKVGQGYKFDLTFKKGLKLDAVVEENFDAWGDEAKASDSGFAPDSIIVTPLGVIKDLTAKVATSGAPSRPGAGAVKKTASKAPEMPF